MTFLNPLVLIGLAAASIPVILHLLSLRKPRTIEFSSLTFLKELQRTSIRRLQLRQILLLILRTACIVSIVFAFARPVIRGSILGTVGTHARTSAVLLLDDSFSMSAADDRGELFKQAKDVARQIVALLKEGDEVSLVRMSDLRNPAHPAATRDFDLVTRTIDDTRVSAFTGSLDDGIRVSARILATAGNSNREVYLVSDLQKTLGPEGAIGRTGAGTILPEGTRIFVFVVGTRDIDNAQVDSVTIGSRIFDRGKPVAITARIRNWGKTPLSGYLVSAYLAGSRVAQQNIDLPPWGSGILNFTVIPKLSGPQRGYVSLEEDGIDEDNRRFFTFTVPQSIRVLLVAPSPRETRFLTLALSAAADDKGEGLFHLGQITPSQFPISDLRTVDVLIFSNVTDLTPNDAARVKSFVERGGGAMVFPGEAARDNGVLFSALDIPPFEKWDADTGSGVLAFQHVDVDHPLFRGMFDAAASPAEPATESPEIHRAVRQRPASHGRTVITMTDQAPFLAEYRAGKGRVLVFSVAPVPTWTDFPLKGIFAPLIHRCVLYAAAQGEQTPTYTVGDQPVFTVSSALARSGQVSAGRLRSPGGTEELLRPLPRPGDGSLRFSLGTLSEAGFYGLFVGGTDSVLFPVNVSPRESDLRKMSDADLVSHLESFGARDPIVMHAPDNIEATVLQSRYGVELWKTCILAAIIIALIEMAVARERGATGKDIVFEEHGQAAKRNYAS